MKTSKSRVNCLYLCLDLMETGQQYRNRTGQKGYNVVLMMEWGNQQDLFTWLLCVAFFLLRSSGLGVLLSIRKGRSDNFFLVISKTERWGEIMRNMFRCLACFGEKGFLFL